MRGGTCYRTAPEQEGVTPEALHRRQFHSTADLSDRQMMRIALPAVDDDLGRQ
jgi:hypothetical protein